MLHFKLFGASAGRGTGRAMLAGARTISVTDRSGAVSFSHASAQAACASAAASRWCFEAAACMRL